MTKLIVSFGKLLSYFLKIFKLGSGATWPGEIALILDPGILTKIVPTNVILVAGTNGKTTTALMIKTILENNGKTVVHNASGANLVNGLVSAIITSRSADYGVFEIDENSLPVVIKMLKPGKAIKCIILLNLFRDQLDRYGEVDSIAKKWKSSLETIDTKLILNADDPEIAALANKNSIFFGLNNTTLFKPVSEHAMDSQFCPRCGTRLNYAGTFYSHLGHYSCSKCHFSRPSPQFFETNYPMTGTYNRYNTLAAVAAAKILNIPPNLKNFSPAFGRQEKIGTTQIFLSKNPAGFNESLRTIIDLKAKSVLVAINDRIPDGRDVSWIWDVDFEMLPGSTKVYVSGDRALDISVRLKYAGIQSEIVLKVPKIDNLFILPTYSAMLDIRKEITGKKIL